MLYIATAIYSSRVLYSTCYNTPRGNKIYSNVHESNHMAMILFLRALCEYCSFYGYDILYIDTYGG